MSVLELRNIYKSFGDTPVLKGVTFSVNKGDVVAVIGKSGAGKTTMLRVMNYLIPPDSGEVYFHGMKVTPERKVLRSVRSKIGFVFQRFNLIRHLTALDNVAIGLVKVKGLKWQQAREIAMKRLEEVDLGNRVHHYPSQLSGGQQQRVGIARALAMEPDLILFDEPTSALDPSLVGEVMSVIKQLSASGTTMVVVTHEMSFARNIASRVVYMEDGQVVYDVAPERFFGSSDERVRLFLNDFLEAV
ncbi:amino acid ABC transporter ATP-binding protein [Kosmotoga pacifica]|uniref:ABC transporter n=1 Tax=Kosmotoga pacifica TaxID=1330330 RepID=A0A0G2ZFW0_9BACT|nr:amino acid ABC transporter ATP-binding protein [Kosmotoga pacifica]AKI97703.1 ABC transporter [Kosmotoga pacifica]